MPRREPHPGETWWWPTLCVRCGTDIGPWEPNAPNSEMTHIHPGGGPNWALNAAHEPVGGDH